MRVLPFTIPNPASQSIVVKEEVLPHFYIYYHRHAEWQITWIHEGEGTLVVGNNMHIFGPNDIFLIGANMPHVFKCEAAYYQPDSQKRIVATSIFFDSHKQLQHLFALPEMHAIQRCLQRIPSGFRIRKQYATLTAQHINNIRFSNSFDRLIHFLQLMISFANMADLQPLAQDFKAHQVTDSEGIRIGEVYNYIFNNFDKDIGLRDVTQVAHMTPQAFCRYFKKHTGHTFVSFLNEVRINEACNKLLLQSGNSISAIAYNAGFNSIAHFNRIFKKTKGKSPREFLDEFATNTHN